MKWVAVLVIVLIMPSVAGGQGLQVPTAEQGRLRADHVRYEAKSKVFIAEGNVRLTLGDVEIRAQRLRLEQEPQVASASGDVVVLQHDISLTAAEVKYEIRPKVGYASGDVVLVQGESTVRAPQMKFDLASQVTVATGGVRIMHKGSTLISGTMVASLRARQAELTGTVTLIRAPRRIEGAKDQIQNALTQQETRITAPLMVFRWDVNEAEAEGGVLMTQPDKVARARRVRYSEVAGRAELEGDVVVEQFSGAWLVKGGIIESPKDQETRSALVSKAILRCARLVIVLAERDMDAQGKVMVTQNGRSISGDGAQYTNRDRRIVVTGNVRLRDEDGSQLRADRVVISLVDETLDATGNVETDFIMKRGK